MKTPKKYDVFISYSRKDFDEVEALVAQLKQAISEYQQENPYLH